MKNDAMMQPFREAVAVTLARTVGIAVIVGAVLAWRWGDMHLWPKASVLVLWPSLGGHFVELFFRNCLRPRLPARRGVQIAARLGVWFIGGTLLALGMMGTAMAMGIRMGLWVVWFGGVGFIALELVVHGIMKMRGAANFYDGRG